MSIWLLYLLFVIVPNLGDACAWLAVGSGIAAGISGFFFCIGSVFASMGDDDSKKFVPVLKPFFKNFMLAFLVCILLGVVTPSEKQLWTVAGGYAATNNAELKKLPDNVLKTANDFLEKVQSKMATPAPEKEKSDDNGKKK